MAIDTYAKLQAAIADTVNRDDLSADVTAFSPAQIDGAIKRAIDYASKSIERDLVSRGGHKNMETVAALTLTPASETLTLPTDFLGVRSLTFTDATGGVLEFTDPNSLFTQYPTTTSGRPQKYSLVGGNTAYLRPVPDSAYPLRIIYTAALEVMTDPTDDNWVLLNAPDIYIGAAMLELCIYLENDDRLQFWKGYYDQKINDLMGDDRQTRWAAVPSMPRLQVTIA